MGEFALTDAGPEKVLTDSVFDLEALQNSPEKPQETVYRWTRINWLVCALLFAAAFAGVVLTYGGFGLSWDEAYYYAPSRDAGQWLGDMLFSRWKPVGRVDIDIFWREIKELPSVTKFANGISLALFSKTYGQLLALRFPSVLAFAATVCLIYFFVFRFYGGSSALIAAIAYALMPRVFGHAHIGGTESITAFIYLLTVFLFLRGIGSWKATLALGIVFGLALDTKINCVFLPFLLILWAHIYHRREYANNVAAMLFLSPIVMVAAWPWLWHDTLARLLDYFQFHAGHQFTSVFYFGTKYNYGASLAPWHYPAVMTLLTVPPITLLLALAGSVWAVTKLRKDAVAVLILANALFPIVISSLPQSPKYDGVRLFFPAFPFIAMLAGLGLHGVLGKSESAGGEAKQWRMLGAGLLILVIAAGIFSVARSHPHELSYFNIFIGGTKGAYDAGLETTYWGEAVNEEVTEYMNSNLPEGASVRTLAVHTRVFDYLQRWGILRKDLMFNLPPPYDYHLLLVRKGLFGRAEWFLFERAVPEKIFSHRGVLLVMIYKTPEEIMLQEKEEPGEENGSGQ